MRSARMVIQAAFGIVILSCVGYYTVHDRFPWQKPPSADELIRALMQAAPDGRAAAAMRLARSEDPRAWRTLVDLALRGEDRTMREATAGAVCKRRAAEAVPLLLEGLEDPAPGVKGAAAKALGLCHDRRAVIPLTRHLPDVDVCETSYCPHEDVIHSLALLGDPSAVPALIDHLVHVSASAAGGSAHQRCEVAGALRTCADSTAAGRLVEALDGQPWVVRLRVLPVLKSLVMSKACLNCIRQQPQEGHRPGCSVGSLQPYLNSSNPDQRVMAAVVLANFHRFLPDLKALLQDPRPALREQTLHALREAPSMKALDLIGACLNDVDASVRRAAVDALPELNEPRVIRHLVTAAGGTDREVRRRAAEVLRGWKNRRSLPELAAQLHHSDSEVRLLVVKAIIENLREPNEWDEQTLDPSTRAAVLEALIPLLNDADPAICRLVAECLVNDQDSTGVVAVKSVLNHRDESVRLQSVAAWNRMASRDGVDGLVPALDDSSSKVRTQAAEVLGYQAMTNASNCLRARESLIAHLKARDLAVAAGACSFFILHGEPGTETILVEALDRLEHDDGAGVAAAFLNSRNPTLVSAGNQWCARHGWTVGSFRPPDPFHPAVPLHGPGWGGR